MFITNNHALFYLCWIKNIWLNIGKSQDIITITVRIIFFFFLSLLMVPIFQKQLLFRWIYFTFLKNILNETWNAFSTMSGPQWKGSKSRDQVRQILAHFLQTSYSNVKLKLLKALQLPKLSKSKVWTSLLRIRSKKLFAETILEKIFETCGSFHGKEHTVRKV